MASDLDVAIERLRELQRAKYCLLVAENVWSHRWVAAFISALGEVADFLLLFSTRQQNLADRSRVSELVQVDVLQGAASAGVLLAHAEADGVVHADRSDSGVQEAVHVCWGLALAIAILGSLVRN